MHIHGCQKIWAIQMPKIKNRDIRILFFFLKKMGGGGIIYLAALIRGGGYSARTAVLCHT